MLGLSLFEREHERFDNLCSVVDADALALSDCDARHELRLAAENAYRFPVADLDGKFIRILTWSLSVGIVVIEFLRTVWKRRNADRAAAFGGKGVGAPERRADKHRDEMLSYSLHLPRPHNGPRFTGADRAR